MLDNKLWPIYNPTGVKNKARISLALCSNAGGSRELLLCFVGKAKMLLTFRRVNIGMLG
jgi:hypothetical protein